MLYNSLKIMLLEKRYVFETHHVNLGKHCTKNSKKIFGENRILIISEYLDDIFEDFGSIGLCIAYIVK